MKSSPLFRLTPLAAALLASFGAQAQLPTNPVLLNGSATINETATGLRVTNLPGTILEWDSFNIGANRSVEFAQISAASAVLNRVTGNGRSEILGALTSNGRVFLLNPNGVLFGNGARVDVQGLVASTLDLSNEDFLAGNYNFTCTNDIACDFGAPDALNPTRNRIVLEDGSEITTRTAGNGGQVWLIARGAVQTEAGSRIDAPLGQVAMAAGREVIVTSPSLGAITFTLDRIASSRIDLAGDIDVERGAAGFFADNIRFAGNVRVPSATDGAGQIVASAGTRIDVADDARLNVSGTANADGGVVRLQAGQTIRVSAAAEIAADGGDFTAEAAGGAGGSIRLDAAEVVLPGSLANDRGDRGPIQLHARGQGAAGLELARYGRILVNETGDFEYELVDGPAFSLDVSTNFIGNSTSSPTRFSSSSTNTRTERGEELLAIAAAGDGNTLLLTRLVTADTVTRNSLLNEGAGDVRTFEGSNTGTRIYRFQLVNAAGESFATTTLATEDVLLANSYSALGLTKGGWVLTETASQPAAITQQLAFVDASGAIVNRVPISNGDHQLEALLNGGVLITERIGGMDVQRVFNAQGEQAPDATTALADLNRLRPLPGSILQQATGEFDERRLVAVTPNEADEFVLAGFDRVTGEQVTRQAGFLPSDFNFDFTSVGENDNTSSSTTYDYGVFDAQGFNPVLSIADSSQSNFTQSVISENESTLSRGGNSTESFPRVLQTLDSNRVGFQFVQRIRSRSETNNVSPRAGGGNDTVNIATSSEALAFRLDQITRRLASTPAAVQSLSGSYLALATAASTPGRSNGEFAPPLPPAPPPVPPSPPVEMPPAPPATPPSTPPSVPPVTPPSPPPVGPVPPPQPSTPPAVPPATPPVTPPSTPPATPPVTPPSTPPVAPPSPPVTPPSTPPVSPPAPATPTPMPVMPSPAPGIALPIRPPQTVVPSPGNVAPTPPNTARPRGPTAQDAGGGEAEVLEEAAQAEADLVRDLVCSELSAADCLKYDTGLSDIKQDMVDRVTRKQLSGRYWEVIDDMDPEMIPKFFQAFADLQLAGELDGEVGEGFEDALFERSIGPDGQPGETALERTLGVYDLLVKQAKTPAEKEQLRRDFAEDLLAAAKDKAASRKPAAPPPPPPPGADVTNDSIIADEAQIQADVAAQNAAREAEAAAEAAAPAPAPNP